MKPVWAVVPVKGFGRGKTRLGGVLPDAARAAFAQDLFEHVVGVLAAASRIDTTLIVTEDEPVARLARARRCEVLVDPPYARLGEVVDAGLARATRGGAAGAVVVMADLPRLRVCDVDSLVQRLDDLDVVAVPDLDDAGTNALGLRPPDRMSSCFGHEDSFARHRRRARELGLRLGVHRAHGLCFDVDDPEDLAAGQPPSAPVGPGRTWRRGFSNR